AVAWPAAFLERAGYRPAVMDVSVEPVDVEKLRRAPIIAVSVPMHTALRLGLEVAAQARSVNPGAHICFFGLYATLNADFLFTHGADSAVGGPARAPLRAPRRRARASGPRRAARGRTPGAARRAASAADRFPGAESGGAALHQEVRAPRARRAHGAGGLRG